MREYNNCQRFIKIVINSESCRITKKSKKSKMSLTHNFKVKLDALDAKFNILSITLTLCLDKSGKLKKSFVK